MLGGLGRWTYPRSVAVLAEEDHLSLQLAGIDQAPQGRQHLGLRCVGADELTGPELHPAAGVVLPNNGGPDGGHECIPRGHSPTLSCSTDTRRLLLEASPKEVQDVLEGRRAHPPQQGDVGVNAVEKELDLDGFKEPI